jgi:hypothetical protein
VGHAVVGVGHVAGHLLVVDADHPDAVGALLEGVHQAHDPVAAQTEHVRHLLADEILRDQLASTHGLPLGSWWTPEYILLPV